MDFSFRTRVTVLPEVFSLAIGNETVLLNPETELCLIIDRNSTRMWSVLSASSSIQDAYDRLLLQEFDVEPARLRNDLSDFLGRLWLNSMIQFEDASSTDEESLTAAGVLA